MTAGIPGAGIAGLFYLLSALAMPFREAWLASRGRSTSSSRRMVKRQASTAVYILAGIWVVLWSLSVAITKLPGFAATTGADTFIRKQQELPRLLSYSSLALSLATLVGVLAAVQLLRLVVRPSRVCALPRNSRLIATPRRAFSSGAQILFLALLLLVHPTACAQAVQPFPDRSALAQHLARADAAFADEDSATAQREYRAVLELDPDHSRAVFRLAQLLERSHRAESERLFHRYTELEPADPWGYIVLAEFLARADRYAEALDQYAQAIRRAPSERDAVLGQARMLGRSGRTDQAIGAYEQWLHLHSGDGDAWRELARERWRAGRPKGAYLALEHAAALVPEEGTAERLELFRRSAVPALEPLFSFSADSDGNTRLRAGLQGDFAVAESARLGILTSHTRVSDASQTRSFRDFGVTARWRPRAAFELDAAGGVLRLSGMQEGTGTRLPATFVPTARLRARATAPGGAARLDVRFNRNLVDATPTLVENRIVRNEVRMRPEFALSRRLRVRALGGVSSIRGGGERNSRHTWGGGAGWSLAPAVELSANYAQIHYARTSRVGYFAPDRIQTVDAGSYLEFESAAAVVALDLGGGVERWKEHGAAFGSWRPSLRAYALLSFPLQPGSELRLEIEGYNTQAGATVAPTSRWKYGSAAVSFRWALP